MILKFIGKISYCKLSAGKDYLNPEFILIVDDILENKQKQKLSEFH